MTLVIAAPSLLHRFTFQIRVQKTCFGRSLPALRKPAQSRWGQRKRYQAASYVSAEMPINDIAESGSIISTLFMSSIGVGIALNIGISALPLLSGAAETKLAGRKSDPDTGESDDVKWGVMSVISFFPLLNWLAWVFAAFDDDDKAPIYYTTAVIYLLPWPSRGFQLDTFTIACLLAGIVHVQVERVAQTEPEEFQLPSPQVVREPLRKAGQLLGDTTKAYEEVVEENVEYTKEKVQQEEQKADMELRARELQDWDARLKDRIENKQE